MRLECVEMHWPELERTDGDFFFFVIQLKALASIKVFLKAKFFFPDLELHKETKPKQCLNQAYLFTIPQIHFLFVEYPLLSVPHFWS